MSNSKNNIKEFIDTRLTKREEKKLKEDFGEFFGLSSLTYYAILRGARKTIKHDHLQFFAKRLKCTMEELLSNRQLDKKRNSRTTLKHLEL